MEEEMELPRPTNYKHAQGAEIHLLYIVGHSQFTTFLLDDNDSSKKARS